MMSVVLRVVFLFVGLLGLQGCVLNDTKTDSTTADDENLLTARDERGFDCPAPQSTGLTCRWNKRDLTYAFDTASYVALPNLDSQLFEATVKRALANVTSSHWTTLSCEETERPSILSPASRGFNARGTQQRPALPRRCRSERC